MTVETILANIREFKLCERIYNFKNSTISQTGLYSIDEVSNSSVTSILAFNIKFIQHSGPFNAIDFRKMYNVSYLGFWNSPTVLGMRIFPKMRIIRFFIVIPTTVSNPTK